jgi:hypothetical protein
MVEHGVALRLMGDLWTKIANDVHAAGWQQDMPTTSRPVLVRFPSV